MVAQPSDSTLRRLILGVILPGFSGTKAPQWLLEAARDGLAGVVLFAQNTPDIATTRSLTDTLHAAGPVLVMVDEEGGDVSRLQAIDGSTLPGAAALGAANDVDLTRQAGHALGGLLAAAGIDVDLAPVLDVASEPNNPVIGVRSFGADPSHVARHGIAFTAGLHDGGVAACAKHFPGHGATTSDSHLELPLLNASAELLHERDLPPFEAVARAGLDALMTGHLLIPAFGPAPASLEPAVTALARKLEGGKDMVIITDALDMAAVAGKNQEQFAEACVRSLEAGADLLCLGTTVNRDDEGLFRRAVEAITTAVRAGRLSAATLERAHTRTERLRERIRTYREAAEAVPAELALELTTRAGTEVAQRAVSVGRGAVTRQRPAALIDLRRRVNHAAGRGSPGFARALERRQPGAPVFTPGAPGADPVSQNLTGLDDFDVIALTREPLADPTEQVDLDAVLTARPDTVVVHGGTAPGAPPADYLVLAHGVGQANAEAALDLILGRADVSPS